jgi:hypothetical protein
LNFQAQLLKGASGAVSAWGKGVDWLLTKAHKDPKKPRRRSSGGAAGGDFLDSDSGDETAAGAQPQDTTCSTTASGATVPFQNGAQEASLHETGGSRRPGVEYARAYTSRWSNQMDAHAREAEEQATASGRVVKRVNEKKRAVDKAVDQKLDERCRKVAEDLLKGGAPGVINGGMNEAGGQRMQVGRPGWRKDPCRQPMSYDGDHV